MTIDKQDICVPVANFVEASSIKPKILVVDDNELNLLIFREMLKDVDAIVIEAHSGEEAVNTLVESAVDEFALILMDVKMPGLNGYETVYELQKKVGDVEIPIIFVTGCKDSDDVNCGYRAGAVDYITRPLDMPHLLGKVSVFLKLFHQRNQMKVLISQLKEEVVERKREVAIRKQREEQIIQMKKMEAIGTLANGFAYDFNNIFKIILAHAEVLRENHVSYERGGLHVERIKEETSRAAKRVEQLLAFGREDSFRPVLFSVNEVVDDALEFLNAILPETITVRKICNTNCDVIEAERGGLFSIILNLVINAAEAMKNSGEIGVHLNSVEVDTEMVEARPGLRLGEYLCLRVLDNGCGMNRETQERIFDPFFTTNHHAASAGLGLSVVFGIVQKHCGLIEVTSEVGKGSTFEVYLPRNAEGIEHSHQVSSSEADEVNVEGTGKCKGHALLVDDNEMVLESAECSLELLGYEVTALTDAWEAIELFRKFPKKYHFVMTDQIMPQISGVELAAKIRKVDSTIPIILVTGFSDVVDWNNFTEYSISGYVQKPYEIATLGSVIDEVLKTVEENRREDKRVVAFTNLE